MGKFAAVAVFVLAMVLIGIFSMKRARTVGDFFLGGRSIGPWMSAFAYGTTYFSAVLFIGYGGKLGWGFGIHTMWIVLGNTLVGGLLAWWLLGKRTRNMTSRLNAMTMPAFLAERYKAPILKVLAACLIFIFLVPYSASVYKGLNYLFQESLIMTEMQALWLLAILTGIYLILGGYFAITITDFMMGLVMLFGAAAMVGILTGKGGGIINTTGLLMNTKICSPALGAPSSMPATFPGWMTLASLVVITSIGPWGLPQMVQKFYSIKSADQVKRAMIVVTLFALVVSFGAYYTGALTHIDVPKLDGTTVSATGDAYTPGSALPVRTGPDGNAVIGPNGKPVIEWDRWMPLYLVQRLPGWIMALIVLVVLSASMSTLSSLVLVSSSAIAMDLYAGVANPRVEKKNVLLLMRVLCGGFVALSLWIALKSPSQIITLMVISWGLLAGAFGAPYVYGLLWKRTTPIGVGAGMLVGAGSAFVLSWVLGDKGITPNDPAIPIAGALAILLPFVVVPIVSLLTPPMSEKDIARAFEDPAPARDETKATPVGT